MLGLIISQRIEKGSLDSPWATLPRHAVILGGTTIKPYCFLGATSTVTNDITVARECIIGAGALIGHSAYIGDMAS